MKEYQFSSRETYKAARKEWSADYQRQVDLIREAKMNVRSANRDWDKSNGASAGTWNAHIILANERKKIIQLLERLGSMKVEAQRQYLEERILKPA